MTHSLTDTFRILDAAANRAREGLRVVEDYARMVLNDGHLSRLLKELRHDLSTITHRLPADQLLAARDTLQDVGTEITVATESHRRSAVEVAIASFKRMQEAVRTLEEYSKIIDPQLAVQFEQLRYRTYTIEKAVLRTESSIRRFVDQKLYLLVTASQCELRFEALVKAALEAGIRLIQLREKAIPDRALIEQARELREWTRAEDCLLIINDRPDLAALCDADGVHVGQEELTVQDARRIVGPDRLVGVSTHSLDQARQAVLEGADYLGVGPTFPSGTKSFDEFPGLPFIREVAAEIQLPWFAIGGIDESNVTDVIGAGASRVAVSGAICRSASPGGVACQIITALSADK